MNQKGFAPIIIILGIVLLLGTVGGTYYLGKLSGNVPVSQVQISPTAQPTKNVISPTSSLLSQVTENNENLTPDEAKRVIPLNETANWKTYTNTKYSFSVRYPLSRSLGLEPQAPDSELLSGRSLDVPGDYSFQNGSILISVRGGGAGSIESWEGLAGSQATDTVVDGIKGKKVFWVDKNRTDNIELYTQVIVVSKDDLNYIISGYVDNNSVEKENFLKEFNQIISTFKFN